VIGEVEVERLTHRKQWIRWEAKCRCGQYAWVVATGFSRRSARRNLGRLLRP